MRRTVVTITAALAACVAAAPAHATGIINADGLSAPITGMQFGVDRSSGTPQMQALTVTRSVDRFSPQFLAGALKRRKFMTVRLKLSTAGAGSQSTGAGIGTTSAWCFANMEIVGDILTEKDERLTFRQPTIFSLSVSDGIGSASTGWMVGKSGC